MYVGVMAGAHPKSVRFYKQVKILRIQHELHMT